MYNYGDSTLKTAYVGCFGDSGDHLKEELSD